MTKIHTATQEITRCSDCPDVIYSFEGKYKCYKRQRLIKDIRGEIPSWCTLPDKEEAK